MLLGTYRLQDSNGRELAALVHGNRLIEATVRIADELKELWASSKSKNVLRRRNKNEWKYFHHIPKIPTSFMNIFRETMRMTQSLSQRLSKRILNESVDRKKYSMKSLLSNWINVAISRTTTPSRVKVSRAKPLGEGDCRTDYNLGQI